MKIFFDLDGTLIDSKQRLYKLFQHLVPSSTLTFDAYWNIKRKQIGHSKILEQFFNYSTIQTEQFQKQWLNTIELPEWLAIDQPFQNVSEFLQKLISSQHALYIVTSRQSEKLAIQQIHNFGWDKYIKKILVTNQIIDKEILIKSCTTVSKTDWLVGDTGKDIQAGKALGIKTAAVLSGFRNKKILQKYQPDVIENTVTEIKF